MKHWIIKRDSKYCDWRVLEKYYCPEKEDSFINRVCTNKSNDLNICNKRTCPIKV